MGVAPHEVDVGGLVDELVDVRALVEKYDDPDRLVFQNGGFQSTKRPGVGDSASIVALELVVCHIGVRALLRC